MLKENLTFQVVKRHIDILTMYVALNGSKLQMKINQTLVIEFKTTGGNNKQNTLTRFEL